MKLRYLLLVVLLTSTPLLADTANLLANPSFETNAAGVSYGTPVTTNGRFIPGGSAAANWTTWANATECGAIITPCEPAFPTPFVTTELVPSTLPGGGDWMIHVTTNGRANGIVQTFLPFNTGPALTWSTVWVFVNSGRVVASGTGNGGNTGFDALSATIGQWELLGAYNGVSPANEFIVYSAQNGGADFYVDLASVNEVPEPASLLLLGTGLLAAGRRVRRWRK